jgi:hypothetical protein
MFIPASLWGGVCVNFTSVYLTAMTKTIGICVHSFEGGTLCFLSVCREGIARMGPHMHPPVALSAVPLALSMPAWDVAVQERFLVLCERMTGVHFPLAGK